MKRFDFEVLRNDKRTKARLGVIHTQHGDIQTPAFVPVGTQATVKSLTPEELNTLGVQLFFVNTYHVYLRPGLEVIKKFGGLYKFMHWDKPLMSDSGGFQVFSLGAKRFVNIAISESAVLDRPRFAQKLSKSELVKKNVYPDDYRPIGELVRVDDAGVTFTSHWDGSKHRFTPEKSIEIQHDLGADIMIAFDECAPFPTTHEYAKKAVGRTHQWAKRSLAAHKVLSSQFTVNREQSTVNRNQALYGVVQGSVYEDLRKESAAAISSMDFDGIAIGGVSVGESKQEMGNVLDWISPLLPDSLPRHLLGVGEIDDIFALVEHGVDTFDCVQPTRLARMGKLLVGNKQINKSDQSANKKHELDITKTLYMADTRPIEEDCLCYTCQNFSRAYIHHLFRVRELLGYRLATIHNLFFIQSLVSQIRESIKTDSFLALKKKWL